MHLFLWCESDDENDDIDAPPVNISPHINFYMFVAHPYTAFVNQLLLHFDLHNLRNISSDPALVTIHELELQLLQRDDQFCADILHRLGIGKAYRFLPKRLSDWFSIHKKVKINSQSPPPWKDACLSRSII